MDDKQAKKMMEQKDKSIENAQKRKVDSIFNSSSARDATLLLTTFYPELALLPEEEKAVAIKTKWKSIRKFLYQELDQPFI